MTLTLILMRHAKSGHPDGVADHDRPLTDRGRADARKMGWWMAELELRPAIALVSSARRTRETWESVSKAFDAAPEVAVDRSLYDANAREMNPLIVAHGGMHGCVLMIGHNPAISEYASSVVRGRVFGAARGSFPPGAALAIALEGSDWRDFWPADGDPIIGFAAPEEL